jgi:hypothetical protein
MNTKREGMERAAFLSFFLFLSFLCNTVYACGGNGEWECVMGESKKQSMNNVEYQILLKTLCVSVSVSLSLRCVSMGLSCMSVWYRFPWNL